MKPSPGPALTDLTDCQQQVFILAGKGMTREEAAVELSRSRLTVRNHEVKIMHKLNVKNRFQLVARAARYLASGLL